MDNLYGGTGQGGNQAGGQKFCAQCGQKLDTGARFCPKCGASCGNGGGRASNPSHGGYGGGNGGGYGGGYSGGYGGGGNSFHMVTDGSPLGQVHELCGGMMSMIFVGLYCLGTLLNLCLNFSLATLGSLIISVLFCVGFGMNLYGARMGQLRDTGMTIISGTLLAQMIMSIVAVSIGGIVFLVALAGLSSYTNVAGFVILTILVVAVLLAFYTAYYGGLRKTALSARGIIRTGSGTIETSVFVIVLMCIAAVMSLLGLFAATGLSSALSHYSYLLGSKADLLDSLLGGNAFVIVVNVAAQVMALILLIQIRGTAGQNGSIPPTAAQGTRYGQYR